MVGVYRYADCFLGLTRTEGDRTTLVRVVLTGSGGPVPGFVGHLHLVCARLGEADGEDCVARVLTDADVADGCLGTVVVHDDGGKRKTMPKKMRRHCYPEFAAMPNQPHRRDFVAFSYRVIMNFHENREGILLKIWNIRVEYVRGNALLPCHATAREIQIVTGVSGVQPALFANARLLRRSYCEIPASGLAQQSAWMWESKERVIIEVATDETEPSYRPAIVLSSLGELEEHDVGLPLLNDCGQRLVHNQVNGVVVLDFPVGGGVADEHGGLIPAHHNPKPLIAFGRSVVQDRHRHRFFRLARGEGKAAGLDRHEVIQPLRGISAALGDIEPAAETVLGPPLDGDRRRLLRGQGHGELGRGAGTLGNGRGVGDGDFHQVVVRDRADGSGVPVLGMARVGQLDFEPLGGFRHPVLQGLHRDGLRLFPGGEDDGPAPLHPDIVMVKGGCGVVFGHPEDGYLILGGSLQRDGEAQFAALFNRRVGYGNPGPRVVVADGHHPPLFVGHGAGDGLQHHHELLVHLVHGVLQRRDRRQGYAGLPGGDGDLRGGGTGVILAGLGLVGVAAAVVKAAVPGLPGEGDVGGGRRVQGYLELGGPALRHRILDCHHRQRRPVHDARSGHGRVSADICDSEAAAKDLLQLLLISDRGRGLLDRVPFWEEEQSVQLERELLYALSAD